MCNRVKVFFLHYQRYAIYIKDVNTERTQFTGKNKEIHIDTLRNIIINCKIIFDNVS